MIGFLVLLGLYLKAPPDYAHSKGDGDGGMYFGRWWELPFLLTLLVFSYLFYLVGLASGAVARVYLRPMRNRTT